MQCPCVRLECRISFGPSRWLISDAVPAADDSIVTNRRGWLGVQRWQRRCQNSDSTRTGVAGRQGTRQT